MPDPSATERALKHERDSALIRWAISRKLDPEALVQIVDDWGTLEDRIEFVDSREWLSDKIDPVEPEVGSIIGRDTGLFYRGCVNMLYGTDNCGKTLLMQHVVMQELEAGHEVMYLDGEEGSPRNMFLRLQTMGCEPEWGERFHYANLTRAPSMENRAMFADIAKRCSLVVIDSAGELMGMFGKDAVKDLETRSILFEMFGRPLAAAGAAVVILDHIAKSSDGSQPIGTIRKRAALDGAGYYMSVDEGDEWSKTKSGHGNLICTKDRNGTYFRGQHVARIQVFPAATSADGALVVELSYCEVDDLIEEDVVIVPPAKTLPDVEARIIDIIDGSSTPVWEAYIITMLKSFGVEMTKTKVRETCERLIKLGWLQRDPAGYKTATLHSV
jgi:hypothetical protein